MRRRLRSRREFVSEGGEPERVRRRRDEALDQLLCACFLQHEAAAFMPCRFGSTLVLVAKTEFLAFPHGVNALK